ncbi:unnamed protein product, partial [Meganyctiphanes norvegica]
MGDSGQAPEKTSHEDISSNHESDEIPPSLESDPEEESAADPPPEQTEELVILDPNAVEIKSIKGRSRRLGDIGDNSNIKTLCVHYIVIKKIKIILKYQYVRHTQMYKNVDFESVDKIVNPEVLGKIAGSRVQKVPLYLSKMVLLKAPDFPMTSAVSREVSSSTRRPPHLGLWNYDADVMANINSISLNQALYTGPNKIA